MVGMLPDSLPHPVFSLGPDFTANNSLQLLLPTHECVAEGPCRVGLAIGQWACLGQFVGWMR